MSKKGSLKSLFPEIASEWHPEKNGDLKPENYSGKSTKKIWWLCSEGHAYDTSIKNRIKKKKYGCPYCIEELNNLLLKEILPIFHYVQN